MEEKIVETLCEVKDRLESHKILQISDYACNVSYVSKFVFDNISLYRVNKELEFSTTCDLCGDDIGNFCC